VFDKSKDVCLFKKTIEVSENSFIDISIMSYNNGDPKIQLSRKNINDGDEKFLKLGRLSLKEIYLLKDELDEICEKAKEMSKNEKITII